MPTDVRKLTDALSVAPQIEASDVASLAGGGFRSIIDNRPDGEEPGQPPAAALAAEAARHGLQFRHLPVVSGQITERDVLAMGQALAELPAPVLAYCRTGTRSTALWALHAARDAPVDAVLATARTAGYDLAGLAPRLRANASGRH